MTETAPFPCATASVDHSFMRLDLSQVTATTVASESSVQQQQQQAEQARAVLEAPAQAGQVVELPHLPAFNHGETGEGEVEHISFQVGELHHQLDSTCRPKMFLVSGAEPDLNAFACFRSSS